MDLLIDTHALLWLIEGRRELSKRARDTIENPDSRLLASAVTAWEFADLQHRGRLPSNASLGEVIARLSLVVLPLPASVWVLASLLPQLHRDPVDRMLVAHAIQADLTLITADKTIRRYPLRTLW